MRQLKSYSCSEWVAGKGGGLTLCSAVDGSAVAEISSEGLDFRAMTDYARHVGRPALRALTFHQRAILLKELALVLMRHKEEFYRLSRETGATRNDSWIDIEGA